MRSGWKISTPRSKMTLLPMARKSPRWNSPVPWLLKARMLAILDDAAVVLAGPADPFLQIDFRLETHQRPSLVDVGNAQLDVGVAFLGEADLRGRSENAHDGAGQAVDRHHRPGVGDDLRPGQR